jgi:tetratricopeptide (TPR) repeat protein
LLACAGLAALAIGATPASASVSSDPARAYVEARAAALSGDHARSAALLAALAQAQPDQTDLARKALLEALGAGQIDLALSVAGRLPAAKLPVEARLLLVSNEVRKRRIDRALAWVQPGSGDSANLSFLIPLLTAWDLAERGDMDRALATIDAIPNNSLLAPLRNEEHALILLKFRRTVDAEGYARRAIGSAGARENRLRLALADGFLAAGDRDRALVMVDGMGSDAAAARQRVLAGKTSGQAIDTPAEALSEALTAFTTDLARLQRGAPPIALGQVARFANPQNSSATMLLALLMETQQRTDEALALLRTIPRDDALGSQVRDVQVKILTESKRLDEAFTVASAAAAARDATINDLSRLGDVYLAMKRYNEAAASYSRAIALANAQGLKSQLWPLLLLQANAFEQADRWPETKAALQQGLALAPDQPLLLNFLGYSKLEHHEDLDAAEAMIRKASELAPDDASITDSLGWAQFKRGKVGEAILTLQTAAEKDPDQADIQEHLGDALFKAGRRYEARFAWNAALVTAEDDTAARVKAKLASGLNPSNAAP